MASRRNAWGLPGRRQGEGRAKTVALAHKPDRKPRKRNPVRRGVLAPAEITGPHPRFRGSQARRADRLPGLIRRGSSAAVNRSMIRVARQEL